MQKSIFSDVCRILSLIDRCTCSLDAIFVWSTLYFTANLICGGAVLAGILQRAHPFNFHFRPRRTQLLGDTVKH